MPVPILALFATTPTTPVLVALKAVGDLVMGVDVAKETQKWLKTLSKVDPRIVPLKDSMIEEARAILEESLLAEGLHLRWVTGSKTTADHEATVRFVAQYSLNMCRQHGHCVGFVDGGRLKGLKSISRRSHQRTR